MGVCAICHSVATITTVTTITTDHTPNSASGESGGVNTGITTTGRAPSVPIATTGGAFFAAALTKPATATPVRSPTARIAPSCAAQPSTQIPTQPAGPQSATTKTGFPSIVVERLPTWTRHFAALRDQLGHAPNARPFGKGVRFMPESEREFRAVQAYMSQLSESDPDVSWFCYSMQEEKPTKVGITGLPTDTDPGMITEAFKSLGFPARFTKCIPGKRGRSGCVFYAQL